MYDISAAVELTDQVDKPNRNKIRKVVLKGEGIQMFRLCTGIRVFLGNYSNRLKKSLVKELFLDLIVN